MTAAARRVFADLRRGEHRHVRVTGFAFDGVGFGERVRPVTPNAFSMALWKERVRSHLRLVLAVTFSAGRDGFRCGSVLMLMAGRADRGRLLVPCGMRGLDRLVTAAAQRGYGRRALVHLMARYAIARAVHFDRWGFPLPLRMTPRAGAGLGLLEHMCNGGMRLRTQGKNVTGRAIGFRLAAEARLRLARCVFDARFFRVAAGTALRRRDAHLVLAELVAFHTSDLAFADVEAMPRDSTRRLPNIGHIDAAARRSLRNSRRGLRGTRSEGSDQNGYQAEHRKQVTPVHVYADISTSAQGPLKDFFVVPAG
jgi:hypothetical protein